MERAPFSSVVPLCKGLLNLTLDLPSFQTLPGLSECGFLQVPINFVAPISTDPKPIYVGVDVYVEIALHIHCQVGGWNCLAKGRSRRDG